jgi:uncharacterized phage protein gp47/JayE
MDLALSGVQDPVTGATLNLVDENDPLNQLKNAVADALSACWEQLEIAYNQFDPLKSSGAALSGLVQLNGILRETAETDTLLRLRQQKETMYTAARQVDAIYGAIIAVPGVQFARVYQNATTTDPDSRGIPAKSIAAVAVGGDDQAIADALFNTVPIGVGYYGSTTKTCVDSIGTQYSVSFLRPSVVQIDIEVDVTVTDLSQWPTNATDAIKGALINYALYGLNPDVGLPPGTTVLNSRLYSPVNSIPGHKITQIKLARHGSALSVQDIAIAWNEVANFILANITVNVS